ncbi:MAG: efflux RND transporter periplasmic adaptor subunit [Betaproteobacteria bacterium HGW-Betaproteobacteria-22]|nr:MAG: efflux RND transporter periplasmic adaptor subunit [Betaproteobacteria bacterium HGW-Betaproteobacteria-22]
MQRIFILFVAVVFIGTGLWYVSRPKPLSVALYEVGAGTVESTVANTRAGAIEACQRTRLSPIIGGRIAYLGVKKGDHVKKGQTLIQLWNDDQQAQVSLAASQVESARKRVGEVCVLAENAEREAGRMAKLRLRGFVSVGAEEKAHSEAMSRRAACESVRTDIVQAQARLNVSKTEQGKTTLIAPFDGVVADIVGELGEYTTPSPPGVATPPVIDLIDTSCLYVEAPMDEVDAPRIVVGQFARVTLDALPNQILNGHVRRVAPYIVAVEKQARTVDIEVALDDEAQFKQLLVGYSADVEIVLKRQENALRIPTSAILEGAKVLVYQPDTHQLTERKINTGVANWEFTEVLGGLKQGEKIVTSLEREGIRAGVSVVPEKVPEN